MAWYDTINTRDALATTLIREAECEKSEPEQYSGERAMAAVMWTIRCRHYWWNDTWKYVIFNPWDFSCWNDYTVEGRDDYQDSAAVESFINETERDFGEEEGTRWGGFGAHENEYPWQTAIRIVNDVMLPTPYIYVIPQNWEELERWTEENLPGSGTRRGPTVLSDGYACDMYLDRVDTAIGNGFTSGEITEDSQPEWSHCWSDFSSETYDTAMRQDSSQRIEYVSIVQLWDHTFGRECRTHTGGRSYCSQGTCTINMDKDPFQPILPEIKLIGGQ